MMDESNENVITNPLYMENSARAANGNYTTALAGTDTAYRKLVLQSLCVVWLWNGTTSNLADWN